MATRPLKPCNKQGCPELVRDGAYCDKHKDDRVKYYDKHERNQESKRFYQSKEWKIVRAYVMARDKGLCLHCLQDDKFTKADVVDHIIPIIVDWSRRLDDTNCQSLCHGCHNVKSAEDRKKYGTS